MTNQIVYLGLVVLGGLVNFGYGWAVSGEAFDWRKALRTGGAVAIACATAYAAAPLAGAVTLQTALAAAAWGFGLAKGADGVKDIIKVHID